MKIREAFWNSWMAGFAGLIGASIGIWLNTWYPNPTLWGAIVIALGFIFMVILLTILQLIVDRFGKAKS